MANEGTEMKLKQERTTEKETSSNPDQPHVTSRSEDLVEYLNHNSALTGGYSEIALEAADSKHPPPCKILQTGYRFHVYVSGC